MGVINVIILGFVLAILDKSQESALPVKQTTQTGGVQHAKPIPQATGQHAQQQTTGKIAHGQKDQQAGAPLHEAQQAGKPLREGQLNAPAADQHMPIPNRPEGWNAQGQEFPAVDNSKPFLPADRHMPRPQQQNAGGLSFQENKFPTVAAEDKPVLHSSVPMAKPLHGTGLDFHHERPLTAGIKHETPLIIPTADQRMDELPKQQQLKKDIIDAKPFPRAAHDAANVAAQSANKIAEIPRQQDTAAELKYQGQQKQQEQKVAAASSGVQHEAKNVVAEKRMAPMIAPQQKQAFAASQQNTGVQSGESQFIAAAEQRVLPLQSNNLKVEQDAQYSAATGKQQKEEKRIVAAETTNQRTIVQQEAALILERPVQTKDAGIKYELPKAIAGAQIREKDQAENVQTAPAAARESQVTRPKRETTNHSAGAAADHHLTKPKHQPIKPAYQGSHLPAPTKFETHKPVAVAAKPLPPHRPVAATSEHHPKTT